MTNDALGSASSWDELSLEKVNDLQAQFTELSRTIASADSSVGNDVDRLEEVTAVITTLQDYFEGKDVPAEMQSFLPTIQPLLSKALRALMQIQGYIQEDVGPIEESSRKAKGGGRKIDLPKLQTPRSSFNDRQQTGNDGTAARRTSRAEFELRARGHHGFIAEDKKIHGILHAPGGRGVNMHDSSYGSFSFDGFNGNAFPGQYNAFPASFQSSSDHVLGRRKLNANGVCAEPNENVLKKKQCDRLVDCVHKFTVSGD